MYRARALILKGMPGICVRLLAVQNVCCPGPLFRLPPPSSIRISHLPPHTCQSDHDPTITLYSFIHHPIHSYKVSEYIGEYLLKGYARHPPSHRLSTPRITLSVTVWVDTSISSKQSRSSSQTLKGLTSKGCATVAQSTCTLSRFNSPSSPPSALPPSLPPSFTHPISLLRHPFPVPPCNCNINEHSPDSISLLLLFLSRHFHSFLPFFARTDYWLCVHRG